ncbi:MAG: hypothetical protein QMD25_03880 [Caldisericia bacterium]|jgi:predicted PurR-regulated permease PerM|nr:hypothetical protein [Caldisericia bacterium]
MNGIIYVVLTLTIINSILILLIFIFLVIYLKEVSNKISSLVEEIKNLMKEIKPSLNKSLKNIEQTTRTIKNITNLISTISPFLIFSSSGNISKIGKYISLFYGIKRGFEIIKLFRKKGGSNE